MTRFLTTPVLYALLAAVIGLGAFATLQTLRLASERTAHAETRTKTAETLRTIATLAREAAEQARKAQIAYHDDLAEARATTRQEFTDALEIQGRIAADLHAGNQQLRNEWRGCVAALPVPGDAEARPGSDEGADLRAAGAGRLIGAGAQADAWIRGLQRELTAAYRLCGPQATNP